MILESVNSQKETVTRKKIGTLKYLCRTKFQPPKTVKCCSFSKRVVLVVVRELSFSSASCCSLLLAASSYSHVYFSLSLLVGIRPMGGALLRISSLGGGEVEAGEQEQTPKTKQPTGHNKEMSK